MELSVRAILESQMEFRDYYATLGVAKTATAKEIKQAYRKLARKFHPDVNPGDKTAEARFKEINEAYEVLSEPENRKKYDELGANWRLYEQRQQAGQPPPGAGWPSGGGRWTVDFGSGPGGFRFSQQETDEIFGEEDPFSDFFKAFFGGVGREPGARYQRAGRTAGRRRGRDVEQPIELSLEDAFEGVTRRLSIKVSGHARAVDVRLPPGVAHGSRVRVASEGELGVGGAASGDLYLGVHVQPHPTFERKGRDLHVRIPVPVTTTVLGGGVTVPRVRGRPLRLKIPEMTQQGQVFRLKGQGMPVVGKPGERGDMYATVNVQMPAHLTKEQRQHYEALAKLESGKKNSAA